MFFVASTFYFTIVARAIQQLFPAFSYRWTVMVLIVMVMIGSMLFPNGIIAHVMFTNIRRWLIIPAIIYPLTVYLIAVLRGIRGRQNEA